MRAQKMPISKVEGIVQIARWMFCRGIQRVKVVIICLNLRSRGDLESHLCENCRYPLQALHDRMRFAVCRFSARKRDVHRFICELLQLLLALQLPRCLLKRFG